MIPASKMAVAKTPLQPSTIFIPKSSEERWVPDTEVHVPNRFKILEEKKAIDAVKGLTNLSWKGW